MSVRARLGLVAIALAVTACSPGTAREAGRAGQVADEAASRLAAAIQRIATNLNKPIKEVEEGFHIKLPNATTEELAESAERSAAKTDALKIAAQEAAAKEAAEQAKTFEAIHSATCDAIGIYSDATKPTDERDEAFKQSIKDHLDALRLAKDDAKVLAVWKAVVKQFESISKNGKFDPDEAVRDFACI